MIIKATDDQVIEMAKLAIMNSIPMGMGFLHFRSELKKEDINLEIINGEVYLDYVQGRMVKFWATKKEDGWKFDDSINPEYQSWCSKYPSYQALFEAVNG